FLLFLVLFDRTNQFKEALFLIESLFGTVIKDGPSIFLGPCLGVIFSHFSIPFKITLVGTEHDGIIIDIFGLLDHIEKGFNLGKGSSVGNIIDNEKSISRSPILISQYCILFLSRYDTMNQCSEQVRMAIRSSK